MTCLGWKEGVLIIFKDLCNERGLISVLLLGFFLTMVMVGLFVASIVGAGVMKNSYKRYKDIDAAIKYAVFADNLNGAVTGTVQLDPVNAQAYFASAFAAVTRSTCSGNLFVGGNFPAPAVLKSFDVITAGDPLPDRLGGVNGVAVQPGYLVTMDVPVFQGTVLGVKLPPFYVTMRRYANVGTVPVGW